MATNTRLDRKPVRLRCPSVKTAKSSFLRSMRSIEASVLRRNLPSTRFSLRISNPLKVLASSTVKRSLLVDSSSLMRTVRFSKRALTR